MLRRLLLVLKMVVVKEWRSDLMIKIEYGGTVESE